MEIPEEIDIFVKRIKNTPLQFRVRTQNKIGDLKEIIYKEHGYSIEYQRIIIQGTQYDDNVPLSYICEKVRKMFKVSSLLILLINSTLFLSH